MTCGGGSSSVFKSALKACVVNICTSSIITTLNFPSRGANLIFSRNSLISSIPRFEAPSISITSMDLPSIICLITSDSISYLIDGLSDPFKHIASNLAAVVLPTPLGPANKKACAIRFFSKALIKVFVIWSCPTTSSKCFGRHFSAKIW